MRLIIAALALACGSTAAEAAPIIRPFETIAFSASGPVRWLNMRYDLSFDPAAAAPTGSISNFRAYAVSQTPFIPSSQVFTGPVGAQFTQSTVTIGGLLSGIGAVTPGTDDFVLSFSYIYNSARGIIIPNSPTMSYTMAGPDQTFDMDYVIAQDAPEPATWALMLLGIGGIGWAMRQRSRRAVA